MNDKKKDKQSLEVKYDRPEDYLYSLERMGDKLGLENIRDFLEIFDEPHKDFETILIGGTNGKGSVATMTANILTKAGYKTGLYISPHLIDFEERIQVDREKISEDNLWKLIKKVKSELDRIEKEDIKKRPSFFEVLTTLAFLYFSETGIDIAVLEVGLGGRLDATNVTDNFASVITTIGYDHSKYLGSTKEEISYEKAGIIKENNYFVTEEKNEKLRDYFKEVCEDRNAEYNYALEREYEIKKNPLRVELKPYGEISVPGVANWHAENAITAITLAEGLQSRNYHIDNDEIVNAIEATVLPGRMEIIKEKPRIMMDSAHNLTGMQALVKGLKDIDYNRLLLVMGVLKDKDYKGMADIIGPECDIAYIGEPVSERKLNSEILADVFSSHCPSQSYTKGINALEEAINEWEGGDLILITGSIYFLGDVRKDGKDRLW